ncbi:Sigma-70, region 4 [Luteibacter sp. UNCMF366Tsu5.1]|nr:Sigma-70, region 4 [Luteibacter sp. UNCMF366Tsu5.1]
MQARLSNMDPKTSTYGRLRSALTTRHAGDVLWLDLIDAIAALPTDARLALLLADVFDASPEDIAMLLHRNPDACRRLIDDAHAQIHAAASSRK